ncbi:MAG: VOC family protein [Actinomycetota bacterium]|nr:VOC family protein [Actinomycetota bacterium]
MDISLKHCFIYVTDAEQALTFYRDALGLELRNDVARDGFRWITLSSPAQPGVEIVVSDYLGSSPADRDALASLITKGALIGAMFATPDLDATFEKVRASGAEVLQEPMDQGWGARDCAFRDPAGNMVRITQA